MTPTQFKEFVENCRTVLGPQGSGAWGAFQMLFDELSGRLDSNPMNPELTQAEVDRLITAYYPKYAEVMTLIEAAGDALNSDAFSR